MLKEKIEILDVANDDVLKISTVKSDLKTDYKKSKSKTNKTAYEDRKVALDSQLDDATTYLVNQYEEFNDYKATKDTHSEKEKALVPIEKEIKALKKQIAATKDKEQKFILRDKLADLKIKKSETKVLYSKSIKNRTYLILSLVIILLIMLGSLLLVYLFINKSPFSTSNGIAAFVIVIVCISLTLVFIAYMIIKERKKWVLDREKPTLLVFLNSIWIMFLDSLGIGSFAVFTSVLKKTRVFTDDKKIPSTLNACGIIAGLFGGSLILTAIDMDIITLIAWVVACCVGSFLGSFVVNKINRKTLTLTMGIILIIATILTLLSMKEIGIFPEGERLGLINRDDWWRMLIGTIMFIGFGMLLSLGIGIYAPVMVVVSLLGMQFVVATPIMILCASFSGLINAYVGMKNNNYLPKTTWTINFGGTIGVLLYFIIIYVCVNTVAGIDLSTISRVLKWISVPVIGYAAFLLLKSYVKLRRLPTQPKIKKKTINKFNINNYIVESKIDYWTENQKLNYPRVHW